MARIIWSNQALEDMRSILAYISKDAPYTAKRFAHKFFLRAEMLAKNPYPGGFIAELDTKIFRELIQGNYRIIY
jgi:toxin ParE1/3/4